MLDAVKLNVFNKTELNVGVNDINYASKLGLKSYNTSAPQLTVSMKTDNQYSLNQIFSKNKEENNLNYLKHQVQSNQEIELKSNLFFNSLNKKFKSQFSGYKENNDFRNILEEFQNKEEIFFNSTFNKVINDEKSFKDDLSSLNSSNFSPLHLVKKNTEFYYDPSDFNINLDKMAENKLIYAQTIALF